MSDEKFCTSCGAGVNGDLEYCPHCGQSMKGSAPAQHQYDKPKNYTVATGILLIIGAILSILVGVACMTTVDAVLGNPDIIKMLAEFGLTPAQYRSASMAIGGFAIVSGLFGAVSGILTFMRKAWILALILCVVFTLMSAVSVIGLILGIICIVLLVMSRHAFN